MVLDITEGDEEFMVIFGTDGIVGGLGSLAVVYGQPRQQCNKFGISVRFFERSALPFRALKSAF